jgi:glycosyltransferase involved in cell wall biosynthesis
MIFFIHPSVHLRTRSTDFLLELFSGREVRCFHDSSWKIDQDFPRVSHMIFHQVFPDLLDIQLLQGKNVTIVPMYDAVLSLRDSQWWEYRQFKTVSFCEALTSKLKKLGMDLFPVKFFPRVATESWRPTDDTPRVFFWRRGARPDLSMVAAMFPEGVQTEILYRSDVGDSIPALPSRMRLIPLPWFSSRQEYLAKVAACDLYVAPRESEGIGLAFLEALSCGVPVLAIDAPTMNEYVQPGRNGFLFGQPAPALTKAVLVHMRDDVLERGRRSRKEFEVQIPALLDYVLQKSKPHPTRYHTGFETIIVVRQLARRIKAWVRAICSKTFQME